MEDVLNKKKPPPQILDLNGMEISSKEEFKVAFDKIPDYKIRKEKVIENWRFVKSIQMCFQHRSALFLFGLLLNSMEYLDFSNQMEVLW